MASNKNELEDTENRLVAESRGRGVGVRGGNSQGDDMDSIVTIVNTVLHS